jgi:hypothetical protein
MRGLLLGLLCACACSQVQVEQSSGSVGVGAGNKGVGINLSPVSYYATQTPFPNLFRSRDHWLSTDGSEWDTELASSIPTDADGYPLEIPFDGQMLRASAFMPIYADSFELLWQGDGSVTVSGTGVDVISQSARSVKFKAGPTMTEPVFVRIERSSAKDHVHDIQITGDRDYAMGFVTAQRSFGVLRFMDWGAINDSPLKHWSDRPTEQDAQGTDRGVAIETMLETANATHADMWFNVPHQADDDFIERAAKLIAARLDRGLKVYVEYSNENWNGIFSQVAWERERALAAGLDEIGSFSRGDDEVDDDAADYWAGLKYSVRRAAAVHTSFRKQLGAGRVIAVLAGQSANAAVNEELLSFYEDRKINPLGGAPDALAVAPYFGKIYSDDDDADAISIERILNDTDASIAESVGKDTRQNRAIADKHHVRLIAYEAGQHVLAVGRLEDDRALIDRMISANRSPRMGELYRKAHVAWEQNGGELIVYYSSCQAPTKHGSWGVLEYQDQPPAEAPKWSALQSIARR